jgi:hypothetical protein
MLTWGALNIVGAGPEAHKQVAAAQREVARAVDAEITTMGIEHDGSEGDLRLPADAPTAWPHGWRVDRGGEVVPPDNEAYTVICPRTGWRVPMVSSFQVQERTRTVLRLVADPARRIYHLRAESVATEVEWDAAAVGTVVRAGEDFVLRHDRGTGEVRVRIANRAKAFLYCLETRCPRTAWMVPMLPSRLISVSRAAVARLVPDPATKHFRIAVDSGVDAEALAAAKASGTVAGRAGLRAGGQAACDADRDVTRRCGVAYPLSDAAG